jgi:hypothetical protein
VRSPLGSLHQSVAISTEIGIGGAVARPPLPHHRAYGSVHGGSAGEAKNRGPVGAGRACQRRHSLDYFLHQPFGSSRAFGPALHREPFGPSLDNPRSFTPLRCREGQLPLVFRPLFAPESRCLLASPFKSFDTVRAFLTLVSTMPSADFYCAIKAPCDAFSHDTVTRSRSPEVSSTAFRAPPPNLRSASLMEMGFATTGPLAPRSRLISGFCPSARIPPCGTPRFLRTPPCDDALALR